MEYDKTNTCIVTSNNTDSIQIRHLNFMRMQKLWRQKNYESKKSTGIDNCDHGVMCSLSGL